MTNINSGRKVNVRHKLNKATKKISKFFYYCCLLSKSPSRYKFNFKMCCNNSFSCCPTTTYTTCSTSCLPCCATTTTTCCTTTTVACCPKPAPVYRLVPKYELKTCNEVVQRSKVITWNEIRPRTEIKQTYQLQRIC